MISEWTNRVAATVKNLKAPSRGKDDTGEGPAGNFKARAFRTLPSHRFIERHKMLGRTIGIENPFFRLQDGRDGATGAIIDGRRHLNYSWCDYLGLSAHPDVVSATHKAIDQWGSCVSASRMVGGQLPIQGELEREIAEFCGTEAALLFVSGHAANVSTISTIVGKNDLIVSDEFVHNSAVVGIRLSGAAHRSFPHNNYDALEQILREARAQYDNVLVVVEGLYSTEGDLVDLARVVDIKERYGAWLMVDDAHGLGVLGATGRGCAEQCGVDPRKIDILMGTLSKTLASCGGYIAGNADLIEILKYTAPGFVYSVGILPSNAAASLAALRVIKAEPGRVKRLRDNGLLFLEEAKRAGLDTGISAGYGMLPLIVGSVPRTGRVVDRMFARGYSMSFIIYPGVPINSGRLRFFLTSEHTREEIVGTIAAAKEEIAKFW